MAIFYLIGGTGNQLFQYAASNTNDRFSTIFLSRSVRKALGWSDHPTVLSFSPRAGLRGFLGLCPLMLDVFLARVFGRTLFTQFDTKRLKTRPQLATLVRCGYFQDEPGQRDIAPLAQTFSSKVSHSQPIVVHIRGGDFVSVAKREKSPILLQPGYYADALEMAVKTLGERAEKPKILFVTDDVDYAQRLIGCVKPELIFSVETFSLEETLSIASKAEIYVSSNSTLSYWIVRLRGDLPSFAPRPFGRNHNWIFQDAVVRVNAEYGTSLID